MRIAGRYASTLEKGKVIIILFWIATLGVSAWLGPKLISATTNSFAPPSNSEAAAANAVLAEYFPQFNPMDSSFVVYVYGGDVLGPETEAFERALRAEVMAHHSAYCETEPCVQSYASYYSLLDQGLPPSMADALVAAHNASTIFTINIAIPFASSHSVTYAQFLQRVLTELRPASDRLGVVLIGLPAFMPLMQSSIERDMGMMDGIVMPIAMIVLCYVIRSVRLMVLPLISTAVSALTSFALVYAVAQRLDIISFVPSLMMSLLLAMGFDYQLFLLTRYSEALRAGQSPRAAVITMLSTAGHTILVSGSTLTVCFLGLVIFPLDLMISTGIGCALAVSVTLIVNITLTPTLLLAFPSFFSLAVAPLTKESIKAFWTCRSHPKVVEAALLGDNGASARAGLITPTRNGDGSDISSSVLGGAPGGLGIVTESSSLLTTLKAFEGTPSRGLTTSSLSAAQAEEHHTFVNSRTILRSFWYKIGTLTQTWPYNLLIIVLVLAATVPFAIHSLNYTTSDAISLDLPRGSVVTEAYVSMCTEFGYGKVYPYFLLLEAPPNTTVLSAPFFNVAHDVVNTLSTLPGTQQADFTGIAYGDGIPIQYEFVSDCNNPALGPTFYNSSACRGLRQAEATFVSSNRRAMLFEFTPAFDPVSKAGHTWYKRARSSLNYLSGKHGISLYLAGMPADSWSAIESAYYWFPIMISITSAVVLLMVGLAFQSILVPIRSVLTIAITNLFVYGAATLTYQYSLLEWTHIPGLKSFGAIEWLPPLVVLPILVGCALDYDIFLLVRVHEYRKTGLSTRDATVKGLTRTGAIISAAGILMSVAFSGLLLSNVAVINQLAFYLVFGVLFDTFVVRPLLVPSAMSFLGEANWWPGRLPPIKLPPLPNPLPGFNPLFSECRGVFRSSTDDAPTSSYLEPATPIISRYG